MDLQPYLTYLEGQQSFLTEQLLALAAINSGSLNHAGVDQVGERVSQLFCDHLDCARQRISLTPYTLYPADGHAISHPLGSAFLLTKHRNAPLQVLLTGHLDTVFPEDSHFQQCQWLDSHTLGGPGVCDMKGGLLVMMQALMILERSPLSSQLGWTVLLNPDEEIGSPGSAALLQEQASAHDLGLIYEPALPDGQLAGERKGSGNFTAIIQGVAAHAGREHHLGRNAICAMAELISRLDQLNGQREGVTLNVGLVNGGEATNQVPDKARCRFNIRTRIREDEHWCHTQINRIIREVCQRDGISIDLHGSFGRPPKQLDKHHLNLYQLVSDCAGQLGEKLSWQATGGCCDGNNLSAAGLPNVDTLGVLGGNIHSDREFVQINSLISRSALSALLLLQLAKAPQNWIRNGRVNYDS